MRGAGPSQGPGRCHRAFVRGHSPVLRARADSAPASRVDNAPVPPLARVLRLPAHVCTQTPGPGSRRRAQGRGPGRSRPPRPRPSDRPLGPGPGGGTRGDTQGASRRGTRATGESAHFSTSLRKGRSHFRRGRGTINSRVCQLRNARTKKEKIKKKRTVGTLARHSRTPSSGLNDDALILPFHIRNFPLSEQPPRNFPV